MAGMTVVRTTSHTSGSRKNPETLIRIVLKRGMNSSGWTCRWSRYASNVPISTICIRLRTRRIRLVRLYEVKSNPRVCRR